MNKTFQLLTICLTTIIFCQSFVKNKKVEIIKIHYSQPVNGYTISIDFTPKVVYYENNIIGRGKIYFRHLKTKQQFEIKNGMMGFPTGVLPIQLSKNKKWIVKLKNQSVKLKYNKNYKTKEKYKYGNFGTTEVPFFFQDINFDGVKELIIPKLNTGQRGVTSFIPYELQNEIIKKTKKSFTNNKPFTELDEMTIFNTSKKEIILHNSTGAFSSYDEVI